MRISQRIAAAILTAALSLSLSGAVMAQKGGRGGAGRNNVVIPRLWENKLNLNADQKTKLEAAALAYDKEAEAAAALTTPKEKRQANRRAKDTYTAAVNSALNPEQQKQLSALRTEASEFAGMPNPMAFATMNLTAEQKTKIKEINAKHQPEIAKLRGELKTAADRKAVQSQIRAANAKLTDELKTVLTAEQVQQIPGQGKGGKRKKKKAAGAA